MTGYCAVNSKNRTETKFRKVCFQISRRHCSMCQIDSKYETRHIYIKQGNASVWGKVNGCSLKVCECLS